MLSWTVDLIGCFKQDNYSGLVLNLFSFFPLPTCFNRPDLRGPLLFTRLVVKPRLVNPPAVVYFDSFLLQNHSSKQHLKLKNGVFMHHNCMRGGLIGHKLQLFKRSRSYLPKYLFPFTAEG